MKKISIFKYFLIALVLIIIYLFINSVIINISQKPVEMVLKSSIWLDNEIKNFSLGSSSISIWDGTSLKFFNFQGQKTADILGNGYFTNVYFLDDEIMILDKQLNILYTYNTLGERKSKIDLQGPVYTVKKINNKYYTIKKENQKEKPYETINILTKTGDEKVYETEKFITNFHIDGSKILVSELSTENFAYKSSFANISGKTTEKYDFDNETILDMKKIGSRILAITNKNVYSLYKNNKSKVELKNFRDYYFDGDNIVVLSDNKVQKFDKNLKLIEAFDVDITSQGIFEYKGGYFVYGPTDMIGFLGEKREFKESFDSIVYGVKANDQAIFVSHKYSGELYTLEEKKEVKDASK